jgi:hypothetical protein
MSLALIQESAKEVRRLAIAGSPLAVGDFRLKKLIPPLEQAGAKVPVFAQVAKGIADLVNGTGADSPTHLLNLSTLLNAILYTQGHSGAEGELKAVEHYPSHCATTRTPARLLKPLIEALTTSGGGRFEIIKSALERGAFNDLRLIEPTIQALDDSYPEIADLVADKILPAFGSGVIPRLKAKFDPKGKKADARRLQVMHELDPAGTVGLCKSALESGSPDVRIAAIACLGRHEECIPLLLEQNKAKNKAVREAALAALAMHDRPEIAKLFTDMIHGKMTDLLAGPLRLVKSPAVFSSLLDEAKSAFEGSLKSDGPSIVRLIQLFQCLQGRKDAETGQFLIGLFAHADTLAKVKGGRDCVVTGTDIIRDLANLLCELGSPQALDTVLKHRDRIPPDSFRLILSSALLTWPASKVYDEFAPLLQQSKGAGKAKREDLERIICVGWYQEDSALQNVSWDPRWLGAAIQADQISIVCRFARPGDDNAISYLTRQLEGKNRSESGSIIEALARCQYSKVTDTFLDLVAKKTKGVKYFDYDLQMLFGSARHLPAVDLPKLDAFAAKLDEKFMDSYLEALAPLRQTHGSQQPTV